MFLVLVGAITSDDTSQKMNVPCHSQKSNHNINDKISHFFTLFTNSHSANSIHLSSVCPFKGTTEGCRNSHIL